MHEPLTPVPAELASVRTARFFSPSPSYNLHFFPYSRPAALSSALQSLSLPRSAPPSPSAASPCRTHFPPFPPPVSRLPQRRPLRTFSPPSRARQWPIRRRRAPVRSPLTGRRTRRSRSRRPSRSLKRRNRRRPKSRRSKQPPDRRMSLLRLGPVSCTAVTGLKARIFLDRAAGPSGAPKQQKQPSPCVSSLG